MDVVFEKPSTLHMHFSSQDPSFGKFHHWFKDAIFKHIPSEKGDNTTSVRFKASGDENDEVRREGEEFAVNVLVRAMHFLHVYDIMLITQSTEKHFFLFMRSVCRRARELNETDLTPDLIMPA